MKYSTLKILISFALFCIFSNVFSQGKTPYFKEIANQVNFNKNRINCATQDFEGFIWVGTNNGLYKSNGLKFIPVSLPDSLSELNITSLYSDDLKNMWIGLNDGKILYINKNGLVNYLENPLQSKITSIKKSNSGALVFGAYGEGILIFSNGKIKVINTESGISDNYIYTIYIDENNAIWAGTDDGVNIIHDAEDSIIIDRITVSDGLPDFIITSIKQDADGLIWIGMHDKGICSYNPITKSFSTPKNLEEWLYGQVRDFIILQNLLWIATENNGIIEYDLTTQQISNYNFANEQEPNRINFLFQDLEGNVWTGNRSKLHLSLGPRLTFFKQINQQSTTNIQALTVDSEDCIWFANDDGIFRYNPVSFNIEDELTEYLYEENNQSQEITCLYEDPFNYIWIGTFGNGLIRLNPKNGKYIRISEKEGLKNGNILSINGTEDKIWFATLAGVSSCNITPSLVDLSYIPKFESFQKEEGLGNNFIYHLYPDKENTVWLATDGNGIIRFSDNRFYNLMENAGFKHKIVYSVTGDELGNIWMNVANEGLYKYDGKNITKYFTDIEHQNLSFSGIQANQHNELIIAYDNGIDVLDIKNDDITHYENNAGLEDCNPNLNTLSSDSKGNVWVGTSLGLVKYTTSPGTFWSKPQTVISEVAVFLEKIDHTKHNSFSYKNNHLSFEYAGIWYQYPDKVEFKVKLEGHDLDWINTKNNHIVYSNLKPGNYTFNVKSALYGNFKNAVLASYSFTIGKAFYMHSWFYITLFIALILIIYSYIKYRENNLKRKQQALQEKIKFQFDNLKSQINPHFLFNSFSTLIALIENDSEEAVDYVQELSNMFRYLLEYKDEDLIPGTTELKIAENYLNLQKKRFGNNLKIEIKDDQIFNKLMIPPLTLQLLIENAIKHNVVSKNKNLFIQIYCDDAKDRIIVKNNLQPKEKDVDSTGIGINNIISRYKILTDKKVEITQTKSEFIVELPFISKT